MEDFEREREGGGVRDGEGGEVRRERETGWVRDGEGGGG